MENNNRLMPHIRRTTHIMKFAHPNVQVSLTLSITG